MIGIDKVKIIIKKDQQRYYKFYYVRLQLEYLIAIHTCIMHCQLFW